MGGRGCTGQRGIKGGKWDNCNSIINKIYFKKEKKLYEKFVELVEISRKTQNI